MLSPDAQLVPGTTYVFEYRPTSFIDGIINNWALQADLARDWGQYGTFGDVSVLGTVKVTLSPHYPSRAGDWAANIKWTIDRRLWGKPSTFIGVDAYAGSFFDKATKPLLEIPETLKTAAWFALAFMVLFVILQVVKVWPAKR